MKDNPRSRRRPRPPAPNAASLLPKLLFLGIALGGAALVCLVKSQNWDLLRTISVPIALIFLYCGLAWRSSWFRVREDQIGDNAYYLGFLFTLSSLAYALWHFASAESGRSPEDIIISFGVALWSTIVGITLRVFFSQLRQDHQDIEKESRATIAETANTLSAELYQASLMFNSYTRSLQQSMEEAFLKARDSATTSLTGSVEKFTSTTQDMVAKIEAVLSEFGEQSKKLNTAATQTVTALETLNLRIERTEAPDALVNRKVDGLFRDMDKSAAKLNDLAGRQTHAVQDLVSTSEILLRNVQALNDHIAGMTDSTAVVGAGAQNMQRITTLVQELQASLSHLSDGFSHLQSRQMQAVRGIEQHATAMGQQLERSRRYTEETHSSLASMTRTLAEKLQE